MEKLLEEYVDKFNENFPIFLLKGIDEDEIMEMIKKCIDEDKPCEIEVDENDDY